MDDIKGGSAVATGCCGRDLLRDGGYEIDKEGERQGKRKRERERERENKQRSDSHPQHHTHLLLLSGGSFGLILSSFPSATFPVVTTIGPLSSSMSRRRATPLLVRFDDGLDLIRD